MGSTAYPKRVTRPLEEAVMVPSSSMVYSAEMLSCRNRPSGSFFCWAYHLPAYCRRTQGVWGLTEESPQPVLMLLRQAESQRENATFQPLQYPRRQGKVVVFSQLQTHPLGVEVLLDRERVHHTGGGPAALDVGEQNNEQSELVVFHSVWQRRQVMVNKATKA